MREILFRGKDIGGNWHYGVPLIFTDDYVCITKPHTYNKKVESNTLGQFTGLTDKNGKKIFEGDIVVMNIKGYNTICKVAWADNVAQFQLWQRNTIPNTPTDLNLGNYDCEIIGNIHDNPELLNPSFKPEYRDGDPDCPICPNCRTPLNEMEDCNCGQKIDWSEEE